MAAIMASGSRVDLLKTITAPSLVIHGRDDVLVPVACGIDTAKQIPNARLEIIEGMGHNLPESLVPK
jgi:proline iminopeptidase